MHVVCRKHTESIAGRKGAKVNPSALRWLHHVHARRKRAEAIAGRKDAKLAAVVISERYDKKAARYATPQVPFPFDSRDTYERSIRQPLGRDFNTDASFRRGSRPCCCVCGLLPPVAATL